MSERCLRRYLNAVICGSNPRNARCVTSRRATGTTRKKSRGPDVAPASPAAAPPPPPPPSGHCATLNYHHVGHETILSRIRGLRSQNAHTQTPFLLKDPRSRQVSDANPGQLDLSRVHAHLRSAAQNRTEQQNLCTCGTDALFRSVVTSPRAPCTAAARSRRWCLDPRG